MSNYNSLKATINANVKQNGNQEITGQVLNGVLNAMVNSLGAGYQYIGIATPTSPGSDQTPDYKCFYLALTPGTYSHLGGLVVNEGEVCILKFDTSWAKEVTGLATKNSVDQKQDVIQDLATIRSGAASGATAVQPAALAAYFLISNIVSQLGESADKVISQAGITAILADYAKINGVYDSMIVGAAKNLVGHGAVPASFLFRTAGGNNDIGTGTARIPTMKGDAIVWNQLFAKGGSYNNNGITISFDSTTGIYTISGTATADASVYLIPGGGWISNLLPANHSGFFSIKKVSGTFSGNSLSDIHANGNGTPSFRFDSDTEKEVINSYSTDRYPIIAFKSGDIFTDYKFRILCFDLTALFNGAVPENYSAAAFKAVYPLGYYASNSGKVIPFAAQNLVTTGFNQWDEEWRRGYYNSDGIYVDSPSGNYISNVNRIPVFPSTTYYFKHPKTSLLVLQWDADGNLISREYAGTEGTGESVTTSANTRYIDFTIGSSAYPVTTYKNDICINLSWSGYRNGEYEPYEKHTLEVDPASWEDTDGNLIFPYGGMFKAGTAYDFAKAENDGYFHYGTRKIERVDLGTLNWSKTSGLFYTTGLDGIAAGENTIICHKYLNVSARDLSQKTFDKSIFGGKSGYLLINTWAVWVNDSAYAESSAADFKAAMSGVYLYYELATPVTKELATPVPASYYVNDFGTEEWQPANTADPYTAPCNLEIAYAMNAVDTLRRLGVNYIKKQSMDNILTAFKTAGIISAYSLTYNSETDEYDCSVTA